MSETQGRHTNTPSQRPTIASIEAAIGANSATVLFTTESGEEIVTPIPTAIFYTQAGYAEQCEALERHAESRGLQKESSSFTQKTNPETDFQREALLDIARKMDPGIEIPEDTRRVAINGHIIFRAIERAIEQKITENDPRIKEIAEAISRGETTFHIQSRLERGMTEKPIPIATFRIKGLTESERHGLVIKYLLKQLFSGRPAIEIGKEVNIDLGLREGESFIAREARLLDFSFRSKTKAEQEIRTEQVAMGPNTLLGSLREWLDSGKTTVFRTDLYLFFPELARLGDCETCLLEPILSPELLSQTNEDTVRAFAEECIEKMENNREAVSVLLGIIWKFESVPVKATIVPIEEADPNAAAYGKAVSILCKIATELREEMMRTHPELSLSEAEGIKALQSIEPIARQRSTIRTLALAVLLIAIGAGIGNFEKIQEYLSGKADSDEQNLPKSAAVLPRSEMPSTKSSLDATIVAVAKDTKEGIEGVRVTAAAKAEPKPDLLAQAAVPAASAATQAEKQAQPTAVLPPTPPKEQQMPPVPEQPKEIKTISIPVVVKTIQFGPKAGQTEIDLNQSKKAWEALGWTLSTSMDTATRAKTLTLTHRDGRVIKFPEITPVAAGQTELPVQVTQ